MKLSECKLEVVGSINRRIEVESIWDKLELKVDVLESINPYPGYYHDVPFDSNKPGFIYLITKTEYNRQSILRASQIIRKKHNLDFDGVASIIYYNNKEYPAIRLKWLEDYSDIEQLILLFQEQGIVFSKKSAMLNARVSLLTKQGFQLIEEGVGLYKDVVDSSTGYVVLPDFLEWEDYKEISQKVKYNWEGQAIDIALGTFYRVFGVQDFIRIHAKDIDKELLAKVQNAFVKEM